MNREEFRAMGIDDHAVLYRGRGCEQCSQTGYHGRMGIFELLLVTDEVRKMIVKKVDAAQIRTVAIEQGMRTLLEDGIQKVTAGRTTLGEVLRVTQEI
jgi:type II secretory ATPase GspE/PulE/Tfp pilus assembly ATPase PilB-like protein